MSAGDFLCKDAQTPLCEYYTAAGAVCSFSTNCEALLEAARESFLPVEAPPASVDFSIRFWVDSANPSQPPWPKPYVRGLDHLAFAGFDSGSSMLADLRTRRVIGRFSAGMAADRAYWKTVILPMLLSILGGSVGITELHCACVAKDEDGLLLAGPSGSGKSTLALALSEIGFGFLSDDRTYCSREDDRVLAWGLPTRLKLRREAGVWFRQLRDRQPTEVQKGEPVYWLDPEHALGLERVRRCQPSALIFLERLDVSEFQLTRMSPGDAMNRLDKDLIAELPDALAKQSEMIAKLVEIPCWLLKYGGEPLSIARKIADHFEGSCLTNRSATRAREIGLAKEKTVESLPSTASVRAPAGSQRQDPLRRFTPTPYTAALPLMGRTVQLETNSLRILEHATKLFNPYPGSPNEHPEFLWRIVTQSHPQMRPPWPKRSAFSDLTLRYAEFGQNNFLAVDLGTREGIGFISEGLSMDPLGLTSPFLDTLFDMTAGSLGLVSFSAACVALGEKGLLVLGAPDNGKTTASYLAAKLGLTFHADQAVFLEMRNGGLRAWGDFFPAAFRPQALHSLPELRILTRRFSYCDFSFYYLDKNRFQPPRAHAVIPTCCVVLDRESASVPHLVPLAQTDFSSWLSTSFAFKDDDLFEGQRARVFNALAELPACHLAYGSDPAIAAPFLREMLMGHDAADDGDPVEVAER